MNDFSKSNPQVLVLGVGNILMGDEGVGVRAIERLVSCYELPASVEVVDGGTSGIELLSFFENKDVVFIIDAIQKKELSPGDVILVDLLKKPHFYRTRISPHQLGISDLLHIATIWEILPKYVNLIGIAPKSLEPGLDLSHEAKNGIDKAIDILLKSLHTFDIILQKK
jgi:hydrogenase maturation protease